MDKKKKFSPTVELRELRAENKAMKNVLHKVYDVLFFDTDREDDDGNELPDAFNPDKEWDSAADFIEMVADELTTIMPRPTLGSTDYPEIKTK